MLSYLPEKDADFRTTQGSLAFASLNQACFADAGVIMVADGVTVEKPIQVCVCFLLTSTALNTEQRSQCVCFFFVRIDRANRPTNEQAWSSSRI